MWRVLVAVAVSGCILGGGSNHQPPPPEPELQVLGVAVGAEVEIVFTEFCRPGCLSEDPRVLRTVTLDNTDAFDLISSTLDDLEQLVVTVRAKKPGDVIVEMSYDSFGGDPITDRAILRAKEITHSKLVVDCSGREGHGLQVPVPTSTVLGISATAWADDFELLYGNLALIVDPQGF